MSLFLDSYRAHHAQATQAPMEFAEAVGLTCLSTIALRHRWLTNGLHPNVMMILAGPSTRDRKSTSVELGESLIQEVAPQRLGPTDFTPEALLSYMGKKRPNPDEDGDPLPAQNTLLLVQSEFGSLLSLMKLSYGSQLQSTFCDLYDGRSVHRIRQGTKQMRVVDPRLSILAGCAYRMFELNTSAEDWGSGFFARLSLITGSPRDVAYDTKPTMDTTLRGTAATQLAYLYDRIQGNPRSIGIEPAAQALYSSAIRSQWSNLGADLDLRGHRERLVTSVLRFGLLYQLDHDPDQDIGVPAMEQAIAWGDKLWKSAGIVWALCSRDFNRRVMRKVVDSINGAGGTLSHAEALRNSHLLAKDFGAIINTLLMAGAISQTKGERGAIYKLIQPPDFIDRD